MNEGMERPRASEKPESKSKVGISRRDFLIKGGAVGAGLALERPLGVLDAVIGKKKKPKDSEEAQGTTSTTKAEIREMNDGISSVARSIDATLKMTPEEFAEWVSTENEDGTNNALYVGGLGAQFNFNFPFYETSADNGFGTRLIINDDDGGQTLSYGHLPGRRFPRVPHASLYKWNPEVQYIGMLNFYNGSVTLPLTGEENGEATMSFGTQIWPDGTKVPFAWVSNLDVPNNPLFGPNQSLFSDQPQPLRTANKNEVSSANYNGSTMTREEFFSELEKNVGNPLITFLNSDSALKNLFYFDEYGSFAQGKDAHIEGLSLFQQLPVYKTLIEAYFNQDPTTFKAAIDQGVQSGYFLGTENATPKQIKKTIKESFASINTVQNLFQHYPLGRVVFVSDATGPEQLRSE